MIAARSGAATSVTISSRCWEASERRYAPPSTVARVASTPTSPRVGDRRRDLGLGLITATTSTPCSAAIPCIPRLPSCRRRRSASRRAPTGTACSGRRPSRSSASDLACTTARRPPEVQVLPRAARPGIRAGPCRYRRPSRRPRSAPAGGVSRHRGYLQEGLRRHDVDREDHDQPAIGPMTCCWPAIAWASSSRPASAAATNRLVVVDEVRSREREQRDDRCHAPGRKKSENSQRSATR